MPTAPDTTALVNSIRSLAPGLEQSDGVRLYVTGTTALNIDVSSKLTSALPIYLVVVIGLALLLLLLVFQSVLIPLKAALGFLLTIGSTFGALVIFGDNAQIKSVGFALAFGVLADVLVVRMAIVPAVMSMLGRSAWWLPRWLARVLPNVDVEGQSLLDRRSGELGA